MGKHKTKRIRKEKRFTVLTGTDFHIPFEDHLCIDVWLQFAQYLSPDILILHEVCDFYQLSRFDKDPARVHTLQEDLDKTFELLKRIRKSLPKTRIIMLESNHDIRLQRFLNTRAPELESLRTLRLIKLLQLSELKIEYHKEYMVRGILFKHGGVVRAYSGYTATAELNRTGCSGITGHSHRLSQVYKRLQGGFYTWIESGCLCKLNPDYVNHPDWQQGCAVVQFLNESRHFYATCIPIIQNKILWGKRTFLARKELGT